MEPLQLIAVVLSLGITAVAVVITARAVVAMLGVIRTGQPASGRTDRPVARAVTVLKETMLHTRMLQWHWIGIMHWFVYAAFIVLSGAVLTGYFQLFDPEFALPLIGHWFGYEWISEFLGLLGTVGIIVLIVYRQVKNPDRLGRRSRFFGSTKWQAYFVEAMVLLESIAILFVRGAEYKLFGEGEKSHFPLSWMVGELFYPEDTTSLENIIFVVATIKIVSAMAWLIVISSNLTMGIAWHRFTAWFNIFFKRESSGRTALGAMKPLTSGGEAVNFEDLEDMDEDTKLGVGAVEDFSWKGILDFTTCTECGRCQSQCPAWNTEKPLSPKLLVMGLRDHAYAKAPYLNAGSEEARAELGGDTLAVAERQLVGKADEGEWFYNPDGGDFVIDEDVLWSCTSCGACVQQCPVDIEHVDHIMDMRRYQILVESNFPAELNGLFKGLENKGNPWNMSPKGRMEWAQGLDFDVPVLGEDAEDMDEFEWLFWVGCAGAYEDRAKKTTRAVAELLDMADVKFAVLGNGETCTGDPARRAGNEFVFQGLATQNAETFKERGVKKVVSTCAHCFNTLKNEYAEFGVELEVVHHTQLLNRLVREKKLTPVASQGADRSSGRSITYHDPCYLGRHNQVYSPPRELLQVIPDAEVKEMPRNSEKSFCCGAGGARMWMEENIGERINVNRTKEAVETGADQIAVGCPFCRVMLSDGLTAQQSKGEAREEVEVLDVAQLLLASVKGEAYAKKQPAAAGTPAAGAAAGAASSDDATKAEPDAGDATQTEDTVTDTEDVGPNAKASGGSSLFDTPAAEDEKAPEAESDSSGGSLFDDGGSLFDSPDEAAASEETAQSSDGDVQDDTSVTEATDEAAEAEQPESADLGGGGSLFDIAGDKPAPATSSEEADGAGEDPAGDSTTDGPVDRAKDDADTDVEPEGEQEPAASGEAAAPSSSIPEGGSLFDIEATEEAPAPQASAAEEPSSEAAGEDPAADSTTDGPVDRAKDDADTDVEPEHTQEPAASGEAAAPSSSIPEGGSLFDIEAPQEAPATQAEPPEASDEPKGEDPAADSTTDGPVDRSKDDADTDVEPEHTQEPAASGEAAAPSSSITEGGSLFDIKAPQEAPATQAEPPEASDGPKGEDPAGDSTTDGPVDRAKDDADTDVEPEGEKAGEPEGEDPAGDSTTDGPVDRAKDDADTDVEPEAEDSGEEAPAEPAKASDGPMTSLHDLKAKVTGGAEADQAEPESGGADADATQVESGDGDEDEDASQDGESESEQPADAPDEEESAKPKPTSSGEAHQPKTDQDIGGADSLFDL